MRISDHAVLRYLERRLGIDVDSVRHEIAAAVDTPLMRDVADFAGETGWSVGLDGMVYCFRGGTMTTCFPR